MSGMVQELLLKEPVNGFQVAFGYATQKRLNKQPSEINNLDLYVAGNVDYKVTDRSSFPKRSQVMQNVAALNNVSMKDAAKTVFKEKSATVEFNKEWKSNLHEKVDSPPKIHNNILYVKSGSGTISAFNTINGKKIWKFKAKEVLMPAIAFNNGKVYMETQNGIIYSVDEKSGKELWKHEVPYPTNAPLIVRGNELIKVSGNGFIYIIDSETGKETAWVGITPRSYSSFTFKNGKAYVGGGRGDFYVFDGQIAKELYKIQTQANISQPEFGKNEFYIGNWGGEIVAVDTDKCVELWKTNIGEAVTSAPVYNNGMLFARSWDGKLFALDANNGTVKWNYYAKGVELKTPSPVVKNGVVYIGDDTGTIHALDAEKGKKINEYQTKDTFSYLSLDGDYLYAVSAGGKIYALKTKIGKAMEEVLQESLESHDDSQSKEDSQDIEFGDGWVIIGTTKVSVQK